MYHTFGDARKPFNETLATLTIDFDSSSSTFGKPVVVKQGGICFRRADGGC